MNKSYHKPEYVGRDQIVPWIWVGSYESVEDWEGDNVIFVHHDVEYYTKGLHIPLLSKRPNSAEDRTGAKVNLKNLSLIHDIISNFRDREEPLLIHCRGGVERSPLCVASYMVKFMYQFDSGPNQRMTRHTYDTAYDFIQGKRSVVEDRRYWLNG